MNEPSMPAAAKRVLLVSYLFPPTGGVGVLRATKFVKYLPEFGWDVTVLTAANPSVPLRDESLLKEIPAETVLRTARTFEPDYAVKSRVTSAAPPSVGWVGRCQQRLRGVIRRLAMAVLQPDAAILWFPRAVREGLKILRETPHDAILVTAPPFSSLLVGAVLARRTGVPLLLDYRDEWSISNAYWENKQQGRVSRRVQRRMQAFVLRQAHTVIATTPGSARAIHAEAVRAGSAAQATHIYNGFDPSDFLPTTQANGRPDFGNGTDRFRITFAGTLWTLTSIEPFVRAMERLAARHPQCLDRLEIVIAGRQVGDEVDHVRRLAALPCRLVDAGFLDHAAALRLMSTSDWLLLTLSDLPEVDRVISSKLFEYLGAGRPILAITGDGDQADILRALPSAALFSPDETDAIAAAIAARLERDPSASVDETSTGDLSRFERRQLTEELASLLDDAACRSSESQSKQFAAVSSAMAEVPG